MDTYIEDGDIAVDQHGRPYFADGIDEAAQRAAFIFSTMKGSFRYDREFGIDWSGYNHSRGPNETIMMICREALTGHGGFGVEDVMMIFDEDHWRMCFTVQAGDETVQKEVNINGHI